jgi:uncharacterized protein (TIGR02996 family)
MPDEDGFLQSILDDPDDDTPRLVYADWLDENGEPARGAFIRAQCRLARLEEDDPARLPLLRDEGAYLPQAQEALASKKRPAWLARLPASVPHGLSFVRGFPGCWTTTAKRFVEKDAALMQVAPIQYARLTNVATSVGHLSRCESLARLRSLDLSGNRIQIDAVLTLTASPHLSGLRRLRWHGGQLTNAKVIVLAAAPWLAGVRDLHLSRNSFRDDGAEAMAGSPHLEGLKMLNWQDNHVGPRGARALATSLRLGRLRTLQLSNNPLGDAGAEALASSERLAGLSSLDVAYSKMGLAGTRALLNPPGLPALTRLRLGGSDWPDDAWAIEPSERLRGGITVDVLTAENSTARAMAGSPLLASCRGLSIASSRLGNEGVRVLAGSPAIRGLEALRLVGWDDLTAVGVRALTESPHLGALRELALGDYTLDDETVAALLEAPFLCRLTRLELICWEPERKGLLRLADSPAVREGIVWLRLPGYGKWLAESRELLPELEERFGPRLSIE